MLYVVEVLRIIQYSVLVVRKCSGIKGSVYKVMKTLICVGCLIPVTGTGHTSVDIGVNASLELVYKFCYLGDILSVDGINSGCLCIAY